MTEKAITTPFTEALDRRTAAVASQATAIEQARAVAEVAAAVKVAQDFPRDLQRAESEMRAACSRLALAQRAFYRVPNRGNGPSVHLARELSRIWGNVQYGVWETRRDDANGVSEIQAWAWDVQTNTRSSRSFVVPHQRMVKGERKPLVDLGDVYLNNQNVGARAVRECIFTVLPTWFAEAAQEACHETLRNGDGTPLSTRIENMVAHYRTRFGVTLAALEARAGRKRGQWDDGDVAQLTITFQALDRGEMRVEDEFEDVGKPSADDFTSTSPPDAPAAPETSPDTGEAAVEGSPSGGEASTDWPNDLTDATRKRMFAVFNKHGIKDRDEQVKGIVGVIGRQIRSRSELTEDEALRVITSVEAYYAGQELPIGGDES